MADLKVQYGESEVLQLTALKDLSDKYTPKNHAEAVALDDNDDAYATVQALIAEFDAEETQICIFECYVKVDVSSTISFCNANLDLLLG